MRAAGRRWAVAFVMATFLPTATRAQDAPSEEELVERWDVPRVMVVGAGRMPRRLEQQVTGLVQQVAEPASSDAYEREARARGLPPASDEAFEALLAEQDVELVVVIEAVRVRRSRRLRVTYREGQFGMALLQEEHPVSGDRLSEPVAQRIVAEARLALAAITRPRGPAGEESPAAAPLVPEVRRPSSTAPRVPGTAVHVGLAAGFGFGMRSFDIPTEPGIVRLTTDPFPAASLRLAIAVEPRARGALSLGGELRYLTSVGLRSTDMRTDGSTRNTSSRSHRLDLQAHADWRLGDPVRGVGLGVGLGWGVRAFDSEAPVTLPDYSLGGPRLLLRASFPLGERIRIELAPELELLVAVDDALERAGVEGSPLSVGGEARVRVVLVGAFHAEALYRESHAFLASQRGDASDVERYATLQLLYRP